MDVPELEASLRKLLKGEFSSLSISFNGHAPNYHDAAQASKDGILGLDDDDWVSPEEKDRAIAGNCVWEIQWYPNTPIGFYRVAASSLAACVAAALEAAEEESA